MDTTNQIISNLQQTLNQINPSIDVDDPIIQDIAINFGANITYDIQTRVNNIQTKFGGSTLSAMSDSELDQYAAATYGLQRDPGTSAVGSVFILTTDSSQDISIPAGSIVSTNDGVWMFSITSPVYIPQASVQNFFNPATGYYEFLCNIQATSPGTDYRVAAYRIGTLGSPLSFNATVVNREPTSGGTDPETTADLIQKIQYYRAAFDVNSEYDLKSTIINNIPTITDVVFNKPHREANLIEAYYIGIDATSATYQTTIGTNLLTIFQLPNAPIREVDSVVLDGVLLNPSDYAYNTTSLALSNNVSVAAGQNLYVLYQYNQINTELSAFFASQADIHQTLWIPKEAIPVSISIDCQVKLSSLILAEETTGDIVDALMSLINTQSFIASISGETLATQLKQSMSNLLKVTITINDLPYIAFSLGQYPVLTIDNITVEQT